MIKSLHCSFFNLHESAWCFVLWKVEDVDKKFEDLQKQRKAGWVKKSPEPVKKVVKVSLSGKLGFDLNEIVLYLLFLNLFCTFHIPTDVTFQCSVPSPFVLGFEWNVLLTPHPPKQSNPCNCLYQQKKNVNKPVLKKPVKSKFAAFKASLKSSAAPAQTIEHDWGLFKVTSPLRKPSYHCEGKRDKRDQRQVCLNLMLRTKKKWCTSNIG